MTFTSANGKLCQNKLMALKYSRARILTGTKVLKEIEKFPQ